MQRPLPVPVAAALSPVDRDSLKQSTRRLLPLVIFVLGQTSAQPQRPSHQDQARDKCRNPVVEVSHGRSLLCFNDDSHTDQKQSRCDERGHREETQPLVLKESVEGAKHEEENADLAQRLANEMIGFPSVEHAPTRCVLLLNRTSTP